MASIVEHYESMEALLNRVETVSPLSSTQTSLGRGSWAGVPTPEAIHLARMGWPEGRRFMSDLITLGKAQTASMSVKGQCLDVGGAYPFIPAAVAGDPMNMWNMSEEANKTKPIIRLYIPNVFPAYFNHHHMQNLGGACLTVVDQIESLGFQTEIVVYYATPVYDKACEGILTCQLKAAGEPLDLDRVAFALCNPAMSRRLWFRIMECSPDFHTLCPSGYGRVINPLPDMVPPHSVVLPAPTAFSKNKTLTARSLETLSSACEWVKEQLRASDFADMLEIE